MNRTALILALVLLSGCARLGITSSIKTTFKETTIGAENIKTWEMYVKNGLWHDIDEEVMKTYYENHLDGTQIISQGSRITGLKSVGIAGEIKAVGAAVVPSAVLTPNPAAVSYFKREEK